MNSEPTFIDLFSGCGGFSLGFLQAGFVHLAGIELNAAASTSYARNIGRVIHRDITNLYSGEVLARIKQRPDIVLASPPCEGFTEANPKRIEDQYHRLYSHPGSLTITAIDWICDLDPEIGFIMENVPAIATGPLRRLIEKEFARIGHERIHFNMVRAEKLGSASRRPRMFISNLRFKEPSEIPAYNRIFPGCSIDRPPGNKGVAECGGNEGDGCEKASSWHDTVTVMDAIDDLPDPTSIHDIDEHHLLSSIGKKDASIRRLRWGEALVTFVSAGGKGKNSWIRLHPFRPAPIIMGKSVFIHPFEDRQLTTREIARLQGFPDWYRFSGNVYEKRNQIGEAVSPLVSRYLATEILHQRRKAI